MKKEDLIKENEKLKEENTTLLDDYKKLSEKYNDIQNLEHINIQLQTENHWLKEEKTRLYNDNSNLLHRLETYETVFEVLKEKVN